MIQGTFLIEDCITNSDALFIKIKKLVKWNTSFASRKTASFGVPYNYSGISYENSKIPSYIKCVFPLIQNIVGFLPNNCLLNYYENQSSSLGFHSDQIDILEEDTGIVIISLGSKRTIRFKNKFNNLIFDFELPSGSLFYMNQQVQENWVHAVLRSESNNFERISLTFRRLKDHV